MVNKHMKKWLVSLTTKEEQIKSSTKYHDAAVRMASIQKSKINKCWQEFQKKETLIHCWQECKLDSYYGKQYGGSSKDKSTTWPRDPASGNTSKGNEVSMWKHYLQAHVNCSWIHKQGYTTNSDFSINVYYVKKP